MLFVKDFKNLKHTVADILMNIILFLPPTSSILFPLSVIIVHIDWHMHVTLQGSYGKVNVVKMRKKDYHYPC